MKRLLPVLVLMCLCLSCACADSLMVEIPVRGASTEIVRAQLEDESWLFLPAFADLKALYPAACETEEEGVWYDAETETYLMHSENLRALFLFSDDPVQQGREYIDNCERHVNRTTGAMAIVGTDGTVEHADRLRQLRGRGNGSWSKEKKSYQIKLEDRADLLGVGEAARTWVLLACAGDPTALRDRVALDLALEMGLEENSHSEFVDLYYDGEYRGLYLLAEKVEIGEGRISGMDYEELIESWNENAGTGLLDELEAADGENAYGNEIRYLKGLHDNGVTDAGAYLLEMESEVTLSDPCWFRMDDGGLIALKNPEHASEAMVRYVSEKLTAARRVLLLGGVSPESGETIDDVFDVDAFARTALLYELSYSDSGFHYSSSYFVLPEGESRFRPGPVWDFENTWFAYRSGVNEGGVGVKDETGWLPEFYSVPEFSRRMGEIYLEQMYPLIRNVLLGQQEGQWLKPLDVYEEQIAASMRMNRRLWDYTPFYRFPEEAYGTDAVEHMRRFIDERSEWLYQAFSHSRAHADAATLWMYAPYTYVESDLQTRVCPWDPLSILSVEAQQISEATEEDYALWQVEILLQRKDGQPVSDPHISVCGTPVSAETLADGTARVVITFEDLSYRPVDYYGEDIGLIYNPDVYAQKYPEVAAEYEDDPQGLMDYFCDEGMYEDHMGNAFFQPSEILLFHPEMMDQFGEDWWTYYWDFLYYGHTDGWLLRVGRGFIPEVADALE